MGAVVLAVVKIMVAKCSTQHGLMQMDASQEIVSTLGRTLLTDVVVMPRFWASLQPCLVNDAALKTLFLVSISSVTAAQQ